MNRNPTSTALQIEGRTFHKRKKATKVGGSVTYACKYGSIRYKEEIGCPAKARGVAKLNEHNEFYTTDIEITTAHNSKCNELFNKSKNTTQVSQSDDEDANHSINESINLNETVSPVTSTTPVETNIPKPKNVSKPKNVPKQSNEITKLKSVLQHIYKQVDSQISVDWNKVKDDASKIQLRNLIGRIQSDLERVKIKLSNDSGMISAAFDSSGLYDLDERKSDFFDTSTLIEKLQPVTSMITNGLPIVNNEDRTNIFTSNQFNNSEIFQHLVNEDYKTNENLDEQDENSIRKVDKKEPKSIKTSDNQSDDLFVQTKRTIEETNYMSDLVNRPKRKRN